MRHDNFDWWLQTGLGKRVHLCPPVGLGAHQPTPIRPAVAARAINTGSKCSFQLADARADWWPSILPNCLKHQCRLNNTGINSRAWLINLQLQEGERSFDESGEVSSRQMDVQLPPSASQDLAFIFKFWTEDNEFTSDSNTKYSHQKCDFGSVSDLTKIKC